MYKKQITLEVSLGVNKEPTLWSQSVDRDRMWVMGEGERG